MKFDQLPPSVNNYLRPSARIVNGRPMVHMYETSEAKDFKKRFRAYLERLAKKQGWDYNITAQGHWYLDCYFIQARTNQDNNNYYKILCDSLKDIIVKDDNNLLVRTQRVLYDAKNPRFVAILKPVHYEGVFESKSEYNDFIESNCIGCSRFNRNCSILKKAKEGRLQEEINNIEGTKVCKKKR